MKNNANYIVIGNKKDIEDIKFILQRVFNNNKTIYNIHNILISNSRIMIKYDNNLATIRFF